MEDEWHSFLTCWNGETGSMDATKKRGDCGQANTAPSGTEVLANPAPFTGQDGDVLTVELGQDGVQAPGPGIFADNNALGSERGSTTSVSEMGRLNHWPDYKAIGPMVVFNSAAVLLAGYSAAHGGARDELGIKHAYCMGASETSERSVNRKRARLSKKPDLEGGAASPKKKRVHQRSVSAARRICVNDEAYADDAFMGNNFLVPAKTEGRMNEHKYVGHVVSTKLCNRNDVPFLQNKAWEEYANGDWVYDFTEVLRDQTADPKVFGDLWLRVWQVSCKVEYTSVRGTPTSTHVTTNGLIWQHRKMHEADAFAHLSTKSFMIGSITTDDQTVLVVVYAHNGHGQYRLGTHSATLAIFASQSMAPEEVESIRVKYHAILRQNHCVGISRTEGFRGAEAVGAAGTAAATLFALCVALLYPTREVNIAHRVACYLEVVREARENQRRTNGPQLLFPSDPAKACLFTVLQFLRRGYWQVTGSKSVHSPNKLEGVGLRHENEARQFAEFHGLSWPSAATVDGMPDEPSWDDPSLAYATDFDYR